MFFYVSEEYDGKKIGYIQFYQLDNKTKKEYGYFTENVYGTDQFIGEIANWNKGIGTLLVKSMIKFLIEDKNADRIVVDSQTKNMRGDKML